MMSNHNSLVPMFLTEFSEPSVTQFASCHLDAYAIFMCILHGLKRNLVHPDAMFLCPACHQSLITVTVLSPEVEVAVCDGAALGAKAAEPHIGKTHGVHSSAYRQEKRG